jgi:hypothetical protein
MARPLLPPRGDFAPTRMTDRSPLPPLRGLAWGWEVTPPLRKQELTALTGMCQAMLSKHISLPRPIPALSWRSTGPRTIIVSFAELPSAVPLDFKLPILIPYSQIPDSKNLESRNPPPS